MTADPCYRLAVTGDVILNTRVSRCREPAVVAALDLLRGADVTHAHLEIPLHDFDGEDVFPAAEGALSWMRGPTVVADELRALGVDLVSTASNHALDHSYGGLRSTIEALDARGLPHAGTGADLAAARAPAFADTAVGRVALVSATSSFPAFARAGAARSDFPGRPGVNPVRYLDVVDPATADRLCALAGALGLWAVRDGDEFVVHPPGLHNSIRRFRVVPGQETPSTVCDPEDLAGNLESLRYAASVADFVVAHLHVQAWDAADGRMSSTPAFAREYAHAAVESGAALVLVQGSHAPMRGIEVVRGVPVLHDPGPLFRLGRREPQPHDFYTRWGNDSRVRSFDAGLLDAFGARDTTTSGKTVLSPAEGNDHRPGFVLPVCEVDAVTHRVRTVELHPMTWSRASRATTGFPAVASDPTGRAVLDRMVALSEPFGTKITVEAGIGRVDLWSKRSR
ncbi:CapA family protein [Amycolatopsis sp. FDAARGOS 1241]|uniref:CapA family protein n=1 Tax=Amycolatopsis sp. FDAARGOS 1241 TaxID=2778070 RepID=UPI00194EEB65|nr:CapA family protein [Amycolatopsis sp. FDAARGOS 1241]QRP42867.1 CapA family protein [Amycolatopsis sp. FDAARGOS 1241]